MTPEERRITFEAAYRGPSQAMIKQFIEINPLMRALAMMTRAQLIEVAIVAWFEKDGWRYNSETGEVTASGLDIELDLTALAAHLDVEWDRISRG